MKRKGCNQRYLCSYVDYLGFDGEDVSGVVAWMMECYEKGLVTKEDLGGIDLTWGNLEAICALLKKIANREGIGDALADGLKFAPAKIGKGTEKYAITSKGVAITSNEPRGSMQDALNMAVTAVGKELGKRDARYLALACRIAAELGARVVKTYWCDKDFDKVVNGCPVPVVMAGGPKCKTELEVFEFVYDGMQKGAIGINLGRNVWQNPNPVGMARALQAVIHKKATAKEAYELFNETKSSIRTCA